jgi:hypothetical protein
MRGLASLKSSFTEADRSKRSKELHKSHGMTEKGAEIAARGR